MDKKRVLLLLSGIMTEFHRGVCNYARSAGWHLTSNMVLDYRHDILNTWKGDGVIVSLGSDPELFEFIQSLDCPFVDLACTRIDISAHRFLPNEDEIARLAYEHFRENGYIHFAFWGRHGYETEKRRRKALNKILSVNSFHLHDLGQGIFIEDMKSNVDILAERLKALPLPCAIFCINDIAAVELIETAMQCGLRIPEDLAVLGSNNNQFAREASPIPLSTIDLSMRVRAEEAAAKLDELMSGNFSKPQEHQYKVRGLIPDKSSDETVFEHEGFTLALSYIKSNFTEQITAEEIAENVSLSRRALERHFSIQLGRTITEEIHRRRIRQAKALLLSSTQAVSKIGKLCGYNYPQSFHKNFFRLEELTPAKFRERYL